MENKVDRHPPYLNWDAVRCCFYKQYEIVWQPKPEARLYSMHGSKDIFTLFHIAMRNFGPLTIDEFRKNTSARTK